MVYESSPEAHGRSKETYVRQAGLIVTGQASLEVAQPQRPTRADKVTREVLAPLAEYGAVSVYDAAAWRQAVVSLSAEGDAGGGLLGERRTEGSG